MSDDEEFDEGILLPAEGPSYTLSLLFEIYARIPRPPSRAVDKDLLALANCLHHSGRLSRQADDDQAISQISSFLTNAILPDDSFTPYPPNLNTPSPPIPSWKLKRATLGLHALTSLLSLPSPLSTTPPPELLLTLITFSSSETPWTSPASSTIARHLMSKYKTQLQSEEFINTYLLQQFIRPLFSQKHAAITAAGRKAMPSSLPPPKVSVMLGKQEEEKELWRWKKQHALVVLAWVVENVSEETLRNQTFPLLLPPLLTLLSGPLSSPPSLITGLTLLPTFFRKLGPRTLKSTGLGDVFMDALMPLLLSFPSLTPLGEAREVLPRVYEAVWGLVDVRYEEVKVMGIQGEKVEKEREEKQKERVKMLEMVFRRGILVGWGHCEDIPDIIQILVTQLDVLVQKLGIHTIRSLKHLIPLLTSPIQDPFLPSTNPTLLTSCLQTLQTTILTTWPRISETVHRRTILKALGVCWGLVRREEESVKANEEYKKEGSGKGKMIEIEEMKEEVKRTGRLFVRALKARGEEWKGGIKGEVEVVGDINKELVEVLFGAAAREVS